MWLIDVLTGWMAIAVGFGFVLYLSALRPAHRRARLGNGKSRTIVLFLFLAALVSLQMRFHLIKLHARTPTSGPVAGATGAPPRNLAKPPSPGPHVPWPVFIALAVAGVVGGLSLVGGPGRLRRSGAGELDAGDESDLVAQVVAETAWASLDDLAQESDPRRAVIAAYARMERGLRRAGIRRDPADTPTEYLTRAFSRLPAGQADAARLTDLYVEARFSDHAVVESMRAAAISALSGLASALAGWRNQPEGVSSS